MFKYMKAKRGCVILFKSALGIIETVGLAAAIEAADTGVKSADVKLLGYELTKGYGLVAVK
jgi:microcompartment protein CcmL/EutN